MSKMTGKEFDEAMAKAIPSSVLKAISHLENAGYEAWVVGGCVKRNR